MARTLGILMWKHFLVRQKKFISTAFELASPCLIFLLLFLIRNFINPQPKAHLKQFDNIHNTEPFLLESRKTRAPMLILYSPETIRTNLLMTEVGERLSLPALTEFPNSNSRGFYPYSNDSYDKLQELILEATDTFCLLEFQDMDGETWPSKLNYTIRMKKDFMPYDYKSYDGQIGHHEYFGTTYEPFLRLQWAVDSSFLHLVTGNTMRQNIYLQEFPYRDLKTNTYAIVIAAILQVVCFESVLLPFVFLMSRLIEERASGVQELVKMVGVSDSTMTISHFLNMVPTLLAFCISGTIFLKVSSNPYIPETNWFFIFLMLAIYFVSIVNFAFVCCYSTKSTQYSVSISLLCYLISWLPARLLEGIVLPKLVLLLTGLLPHVPMYWFWSEIASVEQFGKGVSGADLVESHSFSTCNILLCYVFMVLQSCIFLTMAWYLSYVRPGKYGVAQPWNFVFKKSYWFPKKVTPSEMESLSDVEEEPMTKDPRYFEDLPSDAEIGIKIANVSKVFSNKQRALTNVSLDVLKGEITVLLGHNGAGKTTLMSIITGLISATEGKVFVNGKDISSESGAVRKQMGLCPQHNLFFPHLTVLQHVMFFALLKGKTFAESRKSAFEVLNKLGIDGKANSQSGDLSGGMKRRLQLACTLAGDASVIILDEPTSGLDVETRRELWNLLLALRGSRTVLLTTHFMEEADTLGDRVAALHAGVLSCHATPMFLKKNVGTGYRLTLTTIGLPKEEAITTLIASITPGATLKEETYNSISYNLPAQETSTFPILFNKLEDKRSELMVDSIGVGVSTLEEVFLRLCSDVSTLSEDAVDGQAPEPTYTRKTGAALVLRQIFVLVKRQFKYLVHKKLSFCILQVIIPIAIIFAFTSFWHEETTHTNKPIAMDLDIYKDMPDRRVLFKVPNSEYLKSVGERYKTVKFHDTPDVADFVLRTGAEDLNEYSKYLVGVEANETNAKVLYTTIYRHAAPVALNLLTNILASEFMPAADGHTITTQNYPIENELYRSLNEKIKEPKSVEDSTMWVIIVIFVILSTITNTISLPINERITGTRHIHIMMGCQPAIHWFATLLTASIVYLAALILPTLAAALTDAKSTLNQPKFLGSLFLVLLLSMLAFLLFTYLCSFFFDERSAGLFLVLIIIFAGILPGITKTGTDISKTSLKGWNIPLSISSVVFPTHTATAAVFRLVYVARVNAMCSLNQDRCDNFPPVSIDFKGFDKQICCEEKRDPLCYICYDDYGAGKEIVILFIQAIVYMAFVLMIQYGLFNGLFDGLVNRPYRPPAPRFNDEMVRAERTYVNQAFKLPPKQINEAMLVNDIHKNYFRCLKPQSPINAVKGISFSVKKGECFGLLGVNGAGKSTAFKMITGEISATRGSIFANGHFLKLPREKYLYSLGYCPQFFGLDDFLTGYDNLALLLTLRGLDNKGVKQEVDSWIDIVGLGKYMNKKVCGYSGGCQRRLAAGAALAGGAALALLDEPTSGVDVAARRRVWAALRRGQARGRAILITSHSLDEMEALCSRIAIMCGGELAALGSAAALRAAHAAGHAVLIKLRRASGDVTDSVTKVHSLKQELHEKFNCTLKDEHKTMLHYHINETMRYSELFAELEHLKDMYPHLIEDYSVTETTLEEVFLSFAQPRQPVLSNV